MNLIKKQISYKSIDEIFAKYIVNDELVLGESLFFLYDLVAYFRPKKPKAVANITLRELLDYLIEFDKDRKILQFYLQQVISGRTFNLMVSDAGILQDSDFLFEIRKRISAKILPYQPQKDTLEYVLNQVFYKENDFVWIHKIPFDELIELFETLQLQDIYQFDKAESGAMSEILYSMGLLTQRMSGRSMETAILKMIPKYNHLASPFLGFENELFEIENRLRKGEIQFVDKNDLNYKQLVILHKQCVDLINHAFKNSSKLGITLKVNQSLLRIRQQLDRIHILLDFLVVDAPKDRVENTIQLSLKLIEYNCYKNNISKLLDESTQVVSYEITQYTAKTGEHYITDSAKEYFKMFKAALGAGLVVGFLCIFKVLLSKVDTSDFGFAFLYSMNYAFGFIVIYLCGFALATKQPAMTATTIVKAIEEGIKNHTNTAEKHSAFANLFARLFRSQFIAFVGNVIMAFAVALLLIFLIDYTTGINLTDTKWHSLLKDASPIHSMAIFHAGIAGIFLFLSGIISGNVSNKNKHNQVYYRIQENPFLKTALGTNKASKLASWLEKKWPGIVSNFWFGVFMGSTHSIGIFLGVNLDIRHITFVSGNIALGAYGADFQLTLMTWIWSLLGLFFVGFMNFIVSFGLSLGLALRSRSIPLIEIFSLQKSVWKHFKKHPLQFFFPSRKKKTEVQE
ncbi:recombinase [Flavobacterium sp. xlx-214]|uniref:site-specific recombinase n=1 Tax=unclassified Flavobacterium TaxID=196869 RepID=UPI0013D0C79A|nr:MULTISPECIES: site-specific recombinase [unclassified Flavobacterium]MBA5793667.1 recombinase [Flavobacterium sp. xlx-221]QMI84592.1 recombinase [Flavobacterium sp. xlx-214]